MFRTQKERLAVYNATLMRLLRAEKAAEKSKWYGLVGVLKDELNAMRSVLGMTDEQHAALESAARRKFERSQRAATPAVAAAS